MVPLFVISILTIRMSIEGLCENKSSNQFKSVQKPNHWGFHILPKTNYLTSLKRLNSVLLSKFKIGYEPGHLFEPAK